MPTTLRTLLDRSEFHLRPIVACDADEVLDAPITWVHNSELIDPTPWLEPDQVLLTDGLAFVDGVDGGRAEAYVSRLRARRLRALGFATQVAHETIPEALIAACRSLGFPLFEVADRTPFIAIIRHVADAAAAEQRERLEQSLGAQRAVARAALRPDGLSAILLELERQLDSWVALYDAAGNRVDIDRLSAVPDDLEESVAHAVAEALRRGTPSAARLQTGVTGATLQTLGRRGRLRGILAVGIGVPLGAVESDLVASVIALASIALEQSATLESARLRLRAGVLELLLAGTLEVAGQTAKRLWGELPAAPIRAVVLPAGRGTRDILVDLELFADRRPDRLFFAERDGETAILVRDDDVAAVRGILVRHDVGAGVSGAAEWADLSRALAEARKAAARSTRGRDLVEFESLAAEGILGFLDAAGVEPIAHRILAPVLDSPHEDDRLLLASLAVWLRHNGAWDPAARELNIHRHTLRNRMQSLEAILDVDLSRFADRAELWSALQFVDYPGKADVAG